MHHPFRKLPVLLLLAAAAITLPAAADEAAEIRSARLAQNAAIVRHDLAAIASFWTDNVTICRGLGLQVAGKAGYLELFRNDDPVNGIVYERIPDDIEVGRDWPLAFETGHWVGRRAGQPVLGGRYSAQWVRDGQKWLIRGEVYVALKAEGEGKTMPAAPAATPGGEAGTAIPSLLREFLSRVDDPAMHARFWADDLVYTSGKAEVRSKTDILKNMAAAPQGPAAAAKPTYNAEDVKVRAYGTTAALTFRLVAHNPDGTTQHYRNSGTFLLRNGQWQVVTWQATREPDAK